MTEGLKLDPKQLWLPATLVGAMVVAVAVGSWRLSSAISEQRFLSAGLKALDDRTAQLVVDVGDIKTDVAIIKREVKEDGITLR